MKGTYKKTCKGCGDILCGHLNNDGSYFYHCAVCGSMWRKENGWTMFNDKHRIRRIRESRKKGIRNKNTAEMLEHNLKVFEDQKSKKTEA
jgi:hypothetical protein